MNRVNLPLLPAFVCVLLFWNTQIWAGCPAQTWIGARADRIRLEFAGEMVAIELSR